MNMQSIGGLSASIVGRWAWWQAALAKPDEIGKSLKAAESDPQQGYYRTRRKGGQWEPVAIFYPEGSEQIVGYRAGREVRDVNELWVWSLRYPISYAAYEKAMAGGGFDDEPPAPIGDNSGDADPFASLSRELAGEAEQANEFLRAEVKTQADADRAGIWAKRAADLSKRADGEREREKAPHLQASREVDDKWRPVIGDAKDLSARLKKHIEPFLIAQRRAEEDRQRKAREEAEQTRRKAEEAAAAARSAVALDDAAAARAKDEAERLATQAKIAAAAAEARPVNAGRTGARVSVRTEKVGVVTDYAKAAASLVAMKHADFLADIDRYAARAAKAGLPFDGMEIQSKDKVV